MNICYRLHLYRKYNINYKYIRGRCRKPHIKQAGSQIRKEHEADTNQLNITKFENALEWVQENENSTNKSELVYEYDQVRRESENLYSGPLTRSRRAKINALKK